MGQKIDSLKYGGAMAKHFTGKAVCATNEIAGGLLLYSTLASMLFGGMYINMEDMDTTGTDQQEAVYQQVSDGINNLKATLEENNNLIDMRDGLEKLEDSGMAESIIKSDVPIGDQIEDINTKLYNANYNFERQLKDVLSAIYLSGDETGLALSESSAHDLLTKIADLDISEDMTSKGMELERMLLNERRSEHLDEGFKDIDISSISDASGISDRYELAQTVASNAIGENHAGEVGLIGGFLLSALLPLFVTCNTDYGSTFRQWSYNKPQRPKAKKY